MGSHAAVPGDGESPQDTDQERAELGDLLAGRLSDVEVDAVEAVRAERERE
jgi:hypothetical protein